MVRALNAMSIIFEFGIEKAHLQGPCHIDSLLCVVHCFGWCLCGYCKLRVLLIVVWRVL